MNRDMKYKVGDKVRINSLDWYNENQINGIVTISKSYGDFNFTEDDTHLCGKMVTIKEVCHNEYYTLENDPNGYFWVDEMIEGPVKEIKPKFKVGDKVIFDPYPCKITNVQWKDGYGFVYTVRGTDFGKTVKETDLVFDERTVPNTNEIIKLIKNDWNNFKNRYNIPDDYHFVDKNGNEINISEIVLEKKKKEYPKTYEECCTILGFHYDHYLTYDDEKNLPVSQDESDFINSVDAFAKLLICKKAFWKIAGEEMGLGKSWEPNWDDGCYVIFTNGDGLIKRDIQFNINAILVFPTEEMRDNFYKNFKKEIEECKELL